MYNTLMSARKLVQHGILCTNPTFSLFALFFASVLAPAIVTKSLRVLAESLFRASWFT